MFSGTFSDLFIGILLRHLFYWPVLWSLGLSASPLLGPSAQAAIPRFVMELGEEIPLSRQTQRVWIEHKSLLKVSTASPLHLKPLKTGITRIRLDGNPHEVRIFPLGTRQQLKLWQQLAQRFVSLSADYCDLSICLKGTLYRSEDYARLAQLLEDHPSTGVLLALNVDPAIEKEVHKIISIRLRQKGLTPRRISLTVPWTAYTSASEMTPELENTFRQLGIALLIHPQSPALRDNVRIAVRILEIHHNFERRVGVQWPTSFHADVLNFSQMRSSEESFELALMAAQRNGEARLLAAPTLLCRSGQSAHFFAGGEFPIQVLGPKSKRILWKRYGINLKFKPKLDPLGQMSLQIATEVSTLDPSQQVDGIPALRSNQVSSFFDLIEQKTIAISGLIKSEVSESSEGLPWLKNLPVLGPLFSSRHFQNRKSELVILVTPALME